MLSVERHAAAERIAAVCVCAHAGIVMILLTQTFPNQAPLAAPMAAARTPLLVELFGVQKLLDSVQKSASRDVIAQAQEARIIAIVRKTKLTSEECSEAIQMAEKIWPNNTTVIEHLCGAVGDATSKGRPPLQNFAALAEYYTESQWKKMRSSGSCILSVLLGQASRLGLKYPSETTWQIICALYLLCQGDEGAMCTMSPEEKNKILQFVKKQGRKLLVGTVIMEDLPDHPDELKLRSPAVFLKVFPTEQPTPNPFGIALGMLVPTIKMRNVQSKSHTWPQPMRSLQQLPLDMNACIQMATIFASMQAQDKPLSLQMMQQRARSPLAITDPSSSSLLELTSPIKNPKPLPKSNFWTLQKPIRKAKERSGPLRKPVRKSGRLCR